MVRHRLRQEVLDRLGFIFLERRLGLQEGCQIERRLRKIRKLFKVGEFKRKLEREFEGKFEREFERKFEEIGSLLEKEREEVM
jgi:hypothetical protein